MRHLTARIPNMLPKRRVIGVVANWKLCRCWNSWNFVLAYTFFRMLHLFLFLIIIKKNILYFIIFWDISNFIQKKIYLNKILFIDLWENTKYSLKRRKYALEWIENLINFFGKFSRTVILIIYNFEKNAKCNIVLWKFSSRHYCIRRFYST